MIEFPSCLLSSLHLSVSSFFHSLRSLTSGSVPFTHSFTRPK